MLLGLLPSLEDPLPGGGEATIESLEIRTAILDGLPELPAALERLPCLRRRQRGSVVPQRLDLADDAFELGSLCFRGEPAAMAFRTPVACLGEPS
jgi:hypothetical protein